MSNESTIRKFASQVEETLKKMQLHVGSVRSKYIVEYEISIKGKFLGLKPKFDYKCEYKVASFKDDLINDLKSYIARLEVPLSIAKTLNRNIVISMNIKIKHDTNTNNEVKPLGKLSSTLDLDITGSVIEIKNTLTSKLREVASRL